MPPKESRLLHLLGIIQVHIHQLESMKCGCKIVLHSPEKKEQDEQHSCLVSKKKGEVCSAIHKTTMDYIFIYHLHLTHEMSI